MTIVAVARFSDATILIADSRATWSDSRQNAYEDRLQKILKVGSHAVIAFSGPVSVAAKIDDHLNRKIAGRPRLDSLRLLKHDLPRIARHYYERWQAQTGSKWSFSLILSGDSGTDVPHVWRFRSPRFEATGIDDWCVIGSGVLAATYLAENYEALKDVAEPRERCDRMRNGLVDALRPHNEMTVGGMFQTLVLTPEGVRPVNYSYIDIDPYRSPKGRAMYSDNGRWTQRDIATGAEVSLSQPGTLVSRAAQPLHVEDYLQQDQVPLRWHLAHFITCREVTVDIGTIEFRQVLSAFGALEFPVEVPLKAALAFWGPAGKHSLRYVLTSAGGEAEIHERTIDIAIFPEHFEAIDELRIPVATPGLHFLECWIDQHRLARRAMWFGRFEAPPASDEEARSIIETLQAGQKSATDELMLEKADPRWLTTPSVEAHRQSRCCCVLTDNSLPYTGETTQRTFQPTSPVVSDSYRVFTKLNLSSSTPRLVTRRSCRSSRATRSPPATSHPSRATFSYQSRPPVSTM